MVVVVQCGLLTFDFFNAPCCGEPDDLVKGGGDCPHVMDPRSAKDHLVRRRIVEYYEGDMEFDSGCVEWEGDVPLCEFLFTAESD